MAADKRIVTTIAVIVVVLAATFGYLWWKGQPEAKETKNDPSSNIETPANPAEAQAHVKLKTYYVALSKGDTLGKEIGCGDSLVAIESKPVVSSDVVGDAMKLLLENHDMTVGKDGLYNALYQSDLDYGSSDMSGDTVKVALTGTLVQGGTCDSPRIKAQLEETAMIASGAKKAEITLNDTPLDEVLSTE